MTTTPTASPALPDLARLEALARAADQGEGQHIYTNPRDSIGWQANEAWHHAASPAAVLALIALAHRAQPKGKAPQAEPVAWMVGDELYRSYEEIPGSHLPPRCHPIPLVAATLSPLCGAQHAESGKESVRRHEAIEAAVDQCYPKQDSARPSVNDKIGAARLAFRKGYRAALHSQQAAAPRTDLSKRIRAAATANVTLAQAKLLIGAAGEIERAQQVAAPTWGAVHTVGDMVRNLLTLEQAAPIFTAYHVTIDGERRCRTREVTISKERVVDGKWIDSASKDVPYTHIIWAKPDEPAPQAAAPDALFSY